MVHNNKHILLYHGSKAGIKGNIRPISREKCDFGQGFYMGTNKEQPLTLICNFPEARFYTLDFDMTELNVLNIDVGIQWALLIAYHRGKMENIKDTPLYQRYQRMSEGYDVVVGSIANDRMFVVLDRFFSGIITDAVLIHSLSALKLGKQYVAITNKACKQITVIEEHSLDEQERQDLIRISEENRLDGIRLADQICRQYRREGKFFDEIISEGNLI